MPEFIKSFSDGRDSSYYDYCRQHIGSSASNLSTTEIYYCKTGLETVVMLTCFIGFLCNINFKILGMSLTEHWRVSL